MVFYSALLQHASFMQGPFYGELFSGAVKCGGRREIKMKRRKGAEGAAARSKLRSVSSL